jgi:hypothetical protein
MKGSYVMKHTLLYIALSAALAGTPVAFAQAPESSSGNTTPGSAASQSTPGNSARPAAQTPAASEAMMTRDLATLDSAMEKVHAQMVKINATAEGPEQGELIQAHMDSMEENFKTLQALVEKTDASGVIVTSPAPAPAPSRAPANPTVNPADTGQASAANRPDRTGSATRATPATPATPATRDTRATPATPATPANPGNRNSTTPATGAVASADSDQRVTHATISRELADLDRDMKQAQVRMESIKASNNSQSGRQSVREHLVSLQSNLDTMQSVADDFTELHAPADRSSPSSVTSTPSTLNN